MDDEYAQWLNKWCTAPDYGYKWDMRRKDCAAGSEWVSGEWRLAARGRSLRDVFKGIISRTSDIYTYTRLHIFPSVPWPVLTFITWSDTMLTWCDLSHAGFTSSTSQTTRFPGTRTTDASRWSMLSAIRWPFTLRGLERGERTGGWGCSSGQGTPAGRQGAKARHVKQYGSFVEYITMRMRWGCWLFVDALEPWALSLQFLPFYRNKVQTHSAVVAASRRRCNLHFQVFILEIVFFVNIHVWSSQYQYN